VISPQSGEIKGWDHTDVELSQTKAEDYDALLLPGGVMNPDNLRVIPEAVNFVKKFVDAGKLIGAICHGPWTLIGAGGVKGRTVDERLAISEEEVVTLLHLWQLTTRLTIGT
jgi:protease I